MRAKGKERERVHLMKKALYLDQRVHRSNHPQRENCDSGIRPGIKGVALWREGCCGRGELKADGGVKMGTRVQ